MTTIPFIHNYCDRWCEKCRFAHQCAVGLAEAEMSEDQKDIDKEAFWNNISDQFKNALNLLEKYVTVAGIQMTETDREVAEKISGQNRAKIKENILAKLSKEYVFIVGKINPTSLFDEYKNDLEQNLLMGIISESQAMTKLQKIKDNVDTIEWFKYFIHVKLMRALSSMEENEKSNIQSDSNGSAKIVILSTESSLGAWHVLYDIASNEKGEILDVMAFLSKLLRLTHNTFPNAMKFVRPGFDTGWEAIWEEEE